MWYLIVSILDLCTLTYFFVTKTHKDHTTVVPAKTDNDVMIVYKVIKYLESIDHLFINPIRRIGLIHKRYFDLR